MKKIQINSEINLKKFELIPKIPKLIKKIEIHSEIN